MICVNNRIERFGKRSMMGPMNTERIRDGRNWMLVNTPSLRGEFVNLRTSQDCPVFWSPYRQEIHSGQQTRAGSLWTQKPVAAFECSLSLFLSLTELSDNYSLLSLL